VETVVSKELFRDEYETGQRCILSRGVRRHSEKTPSSEASADREGMKAEPRTLVKLQNFITVNHY